MVLHSLCQYVIQACKGSQITRKDIFNILKSFQKVEDSRGKLEKHTNSKTLEKQEIETGKNVVVVFKQFQLSVV